MSEKIVCEFCNEYEGTKQQVSTHSFHCKKKVEVKTETRQRETEVVRERIPFGTPDKNLKQRNGEDGFMYYTFNDKWQKDPRRLERAEQAGYVRTNAKTVTVGTNDDGSPIYGVEMRIKKEWYDEDQAKKQAELDKVDEAINAGTLESKAGDRRYTPQGIKQWSSNSHEK